MNDTGAASLFTQPRPRRQGARNEGYRAMTAPTPSTRRALFAGVALVALGACGGTLDVDLRPPGLNTSAAAQRAVADRPEPDGRGVISYPNYQVAVARRGDTAGDVAARVDLPAEELARHNGVDPDTTLRQGEVLALPSRVPEPDSTDRRSSLDVAALAGPALDSAAPSEVETETLPAAEDGVAGIAAPQDATEAPEGEDTAQPEEAQSGPGQTASDQDAPGQDASGQEPIRHQVERGETAYSIARLYDVSVRALAEWNGLGPEFRVREGQYLLIPVALEAPRREMAETEEETPPPGTGSPTPPPPSASRPGPDEDPAAATDAAVADAEAAEQDPAPDLGQTDTTAQAEMAMPVDGPIIRDFEKGENNGIAIAAEAGTAVRAAAAGRVAAVTENTEDVAIVVIKHPDNLLTVYVNLAEIAVAKGDTVARGERIAAVAAGDPSFLHFEVTRGTDRVDPTPYLNP